MESRDCWAGAAAFSSGGPRAAVMVSRAFVGGEVLLLMLEELGLLGVWDWTESRIGAAGASGGESESAPVTPDTGFHLNLLESREASHAHTTFASPSYSKVTIV